MSSGIGGIESIWSWEIPSGRELPSRLDKMILEAIAEGSGCWTGPAAEISRSRLGQLFEQLKISLDARPAKASSSPRPGTRIELRFPAPEPSSVLGEALPLAILHEDGDLAVIDKPQGLAVHPSGARSSGTLVNRLLHHFPGLPGIGGEIRPGIVHRLDQDTSGALVVAKTERAMRGLAAIFARHEIERVYWALVYGGPRDDSGKIESKIGRNPRDRKKMTSRVREGRRAVTGYRVLRRFGSTGRAFASWLELRLETGRTHQIRVHLTELGCSIIGDRVYGVPSSRSPKWLALPDAVRVAAGKLPGQALHARVLGFEHPVTGARIRVEAEPPSVFTSLLSTMEQASG